MIRLLVLCINCFGCLALEMKRKKCTVKWTECLADAGLECGVEHRGRTAWLRHPHQKNVEGESAFEEKSEEYLHSTQYN